MLIIPLILDWVTLIFLLRRLVFFVLMLLPKSNFWIWPPKVSPLLQFGQKLDRLRIFWLFRSHCLDHFFSDLLIGESIVFIGVLPLFYLLVNIIYALPLVITIFFIFDNNFGSLFQGKGIRLLLSHIDRTSITLTTWRIGANIFIVVFVFALFWTFVRPL